MQTCYEKKRLCPITSSRSADDPISHLSNGNATSLKSLIALRWKIGLTELPAVCSFSWTVLHCAWPSGCLELYKEYQWSNDNWNSDLNSLIIPSTRQLFCWIYANQNATRECQLFFSFLLQLFWCWCNSVQWWLWTSRTNKQWIYSSGMDIVLSCRASAGRYSSCSFYVCRRTEFKSSKSSNGTRVCFWAGCLLYSTLTETWEAAGRRSSTETCLTPAGSSCRMFCIC